MYRGKKRRLPMRKCNMKKKPEEPPIKENILPSTSSSSTSSSDSSNSDSSVPGQQLQTLRYSGRNLLKHIRRQIAMETYCLFLEARKSKRTRRNKIIQHIASFGHRFQPYQNPELFLIPAYKRDDTARLVLLIPDKNTDTFVRISQEKLFEIMHQHPLPQPDSYLRMLAPWPENKGTVTSFLNVPPIYLPKKVRRKAGEGAAHVLSVHVMNYGRIYYEAFGFNNPFSSATENILVDLANKLLKYVAQSRNVEILELVNHQE